MQANALGLLVGARPVVVKTARGEGLAFFPSAEASKAALKNGSAVIHGATITMTNGPTKLSYVPKPAAK